MKRRQFIGTAGLAGILAAGVAPAVQAGQATRWRLVSRFPRTMDVAHEGMAYFVSQLKEMSAGRFEVAMISTDELSGNASVLESVQRGSVECGHTSASYYIHKDETFALDHALPFGLNARQMNAWMLHGNGLTMLREFYKGQGVVNFPMGNTGAQMGGWYRKPLRGLADLKNLKIRASGLGGRVAGRLGAKVFHHSSTETFTALQKGTLDAAEWGSPHDDLRLGLHDVCTYYASPGWWKGGAQFSLYINHRAYDALSDENQALVENAVAATHAAIQADYDLKNAFAIDQLVATGTRLVPLPRGILDTAWKASQELYAEISARNPVWRKIYTSYAQFLRDRSPGWHHAETGYDQMMSAYLARPKEKPGPHRRPAARPQPQD